MRVAYDARVRDWVRPRGAGLGAKAGAVLVAGFRVVRGWARSRVLRWARSRVLRWVRSGCCAGCERVRMVRSRRRRIQARSS